MSQDDEIRYNISQTGFSEMLSSFMVLEYLKDFSNSHNLNFLETLKKIANETIIDFTLPETPQESQLILDDFKKRVKKMVQAQ